MENQPSGKGRGQESSIRETLARRTENVGSFSPQTKTDIAELFTFVKETPMNSFSVVVLLVNFQN